MELSLNNTNRIILERGQTLRIRDGKGARLICSRGMLWITQDGDQRDILVGAGASFLIERSGVTVVNGIESSRLIVEAPQIPQLRHMPQDLAARATGFITSAARFLLGKLGHAILHAHMARWRYAVRY